MALTRQRIAAAAAELHETVGPARTSLSAVADLAGVQRHTVYRHFATETELFEACSGHFFREHPLPDAQAWRQISDPRRRLQRALGDLYSYYRSVERMFSNVLRDAEQIEALRQVLVPFEKYLAELAALLAVGWTSDRRRKRLVAVATRHVVDFPTWKSLNRDNRLAQVDGIELAVGLVESAATPRSEPSNGAS